MKVVIAGGSGHLGTILTAAYRERGRTVVILSRNRDVDGVLWDGRTLGPWSTEIDGADVVINLAGRSVDCRYSARHRAEIMTSRADSTRVVGEAIARAARPPSVWLQASTATIYAHRYDAANDESSGILGGDESNAPDSWRFSIDVAKAWEEVCDEAQVPMTRKVKMRMAMVMSASPRSPFSLLRRHVRLGFGRFGDGRQYFSWIHERDLIRAVDWLIEHNGIEGAVNLAAPNPIASAEFLDILGGCLGKRPLIPVSGPVLDFGAWLVRTEPELVLKSRRVVPGRLLAGGFTFEYPDWRRAALDLCARSNGTAMVW